jgi:acyl-coenzyme A synthetase/AMP-(fatty) acid ligase
MTAVIPDMDPRKPAQVDPEKIIEPILNHGVTNMFASPALLNRVGRFGERKRHVRLPSLRRVVSAGAPVSPANIEQFSFHAERWTSRSPHPLRRHRSRPHHLPSAAMRFCQ